MITVWDARNGEKRQLNTETDEGKELAKKIQEEMFGMEIVDNDTNADITFGIF